jgi:hypothetical protein
MSQRRLGRGKLQVILLGLALAQMLGQVCFKASAAAVNQRGWVISQSTKLNGDLIIYLGPEAMKVDFVASGISVLVHRNSPKISIWNTLSHKMIETDWHQMTPLAGTTVLMGGYLRELPLEKDVGTTSGAIAGLDSMQYSMPRSARRPVKHDTAPSKDEYRIVPRTSLSDAQFWVSTKLPLSESESQVIRRISCLPPLGGIPLRMFLYTDSGAVCKEVETTKAVQQNLSAATFAEPHDYARAKTQQEVCFNNTRLNRLMNVFDSWRDMP